MVDIHSTAIVSTKAKLGNNVKVGPFTIIHDDVEVGDNCIIDSHAVLYDGARLAERVHIFQGVSVANVPQDLKFGNEISYFFIDSDTQIREFVTLHRGTHATGKSSVGKNCLIMAYCHVAHDCVVGNNVIIANGVQLAGHCQLEDHVIVGGLSGIHQFSKIGAHAMISFQAKINADVPPFLMVGGAPARYEGINKIGLRRRGFTPEQLDAIKETYRIFYLSGLLFSEAKEKISSELGHIEVVKQILNFMAKSNRSIIRK